MISVIGIFRSPHRQPTLQGVEAVEAILESTPGTPSYMIGVQENKIIRVPLMEAVEKVRFLLFVPFSLMLTLIRRGT